MSRPESCWFCGRIYTPGRLHEHRCNLRGSGPFDQDEEEQPVQGGQSARGEERCGGTREARPLDPVA